MYMYMCIYIYIKFYLFIFGCAESSLLCRGSVESITGLPEKSPTFLIFTMFFYVYYSARSKNLTFVFYIFVSFSGTGSQEMVGTSSL